MAHNASRIRACEMAGTFVEHRYSRLDFIGSAKSTVASCVDGFLEERFRQMARPEVHPSDHGLRRASNVDR